MPDPMQQALQPWLTLIIQAARKYNLPPEILAGLVAYESGGNPHARGGATGATGLGQIMPQEAGPVFANRPTSQQLLDPTTNLEWSARILAGGVQRYGSLEKGLASYLGAIDNQGNISGAVDANGVGGPSYIRSVLGYANRLGDWVAQHTASGVTEAAPGVVPMAGETPPAENELTLEFARQKTDAEARLKAAQERLDAITLIQAYNADRIGPNGKLRPKEQWTPTDQWLTARGITKDGKPDLDRLARAQALYDESGVVGPTEEAKELTRIRQEQTKAQADLERAGAKLAEAQRNARKTPPPKSQIQQFGSAAAPDWRAYNEQTGQWEPLANQPVPAPTGAAGETPALKAEREAAAAVSAASAAHTTALTAGLPSGPEAAALRTAEVAQRQATTAAQQATQALGELKLKAEQQRQERWATLVQPVIDRGGSPEEIKTAWVQASSDFEDYVKVLSQQLQQQQQVETERHAREEESRQRAQLEINQSAEQRNVATLAAELGSNAYGTAALNRGGAVNPAQPPPDVNALAPVQPGGDPNESVGMRLLRRLLGGGVGLNAQGVLQPGMTGPVPAGPWSTIQPQAAAQNFSAPFPQMAEDLGPSGRSGFAQNWEIDPQTGQRRRPIEGPYAIQPFQAPMAA